MPSFHGYTSAVPSSPPDQPCQHFYMKTFSTTPAERHEAIWWLKSRLDNQLVNRQKIDLDGIS